MPDIPAFFNVVGNIDKRGAFVSISARTKMHLFADSKLMLQSNIINLNLF